MAFRLAWTMVILASITMSRASNTTHPNDCTTVRRLFVMKGIGSPHLVPNSMIKGEGLQLCPSSSSCCSRGMEEKYEHQVQKDFKGMLQSSGSYLKTLIATSATKFKDTFLEMIQLAENSTTSIFSEVYQIIEEQAKVPLGQLFADLLAYMSGQDVDLEDRVNSFFDSLFPLAFHQSVNSKQREFAASYQECLREVQAEVRPFGDLPVNIVLHITRSFEAARTFLNALQVGVEVLNTTEHLDLSLSCKAAMVRLSYCPHCQNIVDSRPCTGLCLNVIRGCLSSVSELDTSWSEYVGALERLTSGMVGTYNIEQVLSTLDTKISETMLYVMENTPEITKRVKQKCGHLRRVTRDTTPATSPHPAVASSPSAFRSPLPGDTSLYIQLQNFVHKIAESKLYYSNLADDLCGDKGLSSTHSNNHRCWNGEQMAEYKKTIVGIGIAAQKFNPEMRAPKAREVAIDTLIEKLQHMRQVLSTRVTSIPQSDESALVEGSGSGSYGRSDDEDYDTGSGSGNYGIKEDKTDLHFENPDGGSGNKKNHSGSSSRRSNNLFLTFICIIPMYTLFRLSSPQTP